jgi:SSS family solute:Na+ symporter
VNLSRLDWLILLLYCGAVVGIGYALKPKTKTGKDFLEAGRALPAWICGLAFAAAGLGAPEVIGLGAWGARYGLASARFVALGVIPAMLFVGVVMMPLYYGSKARTTAEYLRLRFDAKTRLLNAATFAALTVVSSGISLCIAARLMQALHLFDRIFRAWGWPLEGIFTFCIVLTAAIVLVYLLLGGLAGAVYNRVLQFFLLVAGLLPVVLVGLRTIGGWSGLKASFPVTFLHEGTGAAYGAGMSGAAAVGLVVLLAAGFWCCDFRAIQTALAAKDMESARRAPLIAAIPMLFLPFLLVLPGMVAIGLPTPHTTTVERIEGGAIFRTTTVVRPEVEAGNGLVPARVDRTTGRPMRAADGEPVLDYEMATPSLLHLLPAGLLGLGLTALLASLMSGVAANITAFNAVFTCDLYPSCVRKGAGETHDLQVGRWATVGAVLLSVGMAYAASGLNNSLDALILAFSVVSAPMLAVFLLGMFWKRATGHGAFAGLIAGMGAAVLHHGLTLPAGVQPGMHGGWIAVLHRYSGGIEQSFGTAMIAFSASLIVTKVVSLCTKARPDAELVGLVCSLTPKPARAKSVWRKRPEALAVAILLAAVVLSVLFA